MQLFWKNISRWFAAHSGRLKLLHKHPVWLAVSVFTGLLLAGSLVLYIASRHSVASFHPDTNFIAIISHDGVKESVPTRERTVGDLLHKLHVGVGLRDRVEPSVSTVIAQDNFHINVYRAIPVTVYDGPISTNTFSAGATPRAILADAGMKIYPEDQLTVEPVVNLVSEQSLGTKITINRSVPVILSVYGAILPLRTHAATVGDLLKANNVKIGPKDSVQPAKSTPVTADMQVFVVRKGTQIVAVTQTIPSPQQIVTDNSLSFGTSAVRQQGTPGTQVLTYQVNLQNGIEVSRTLLQSVVTVQPVPTIVARGQAVSIPADKQAVMAQAGIVPNDYKYVDYIAGHEGGWCPTKIQGTHDCPGYMDPNNVPAGGGYGIFQATPGRKMASAGPNWATDAVTQIRWATGYAVGRYGSWEGAYNHWVSSHNW
ncbi:MAG TPA: ubiquitin-like domain-containing protein [Candidatus Saccharimonadales bacterium]|nr:ubiquitin-like domain-containing protein [Candidatus Saccharimonadales bacterium]